MANSVQSLNAVLSWLISADREFRATQAAVNNAYDRF